MHIADKLSLCRRLLLLTSLFPPPLHIYARIIIFCFIGFLISHISADFAGHISDILLAAIFTRPLTLFISIFWHARIIYRFQSMYADISLAFHFIFSCNAGQFSHYFNILPALVFIDIFDIYDDTGASRVRLAFIFAAGSLHDIYYWYFYFEIFDVTSLDDLFLCFRFSFSRYIRRRIPHFLLNFFW